MSTAKRRAPFRGASQCFLPLQSALVLVFDIFSYALRGMGCVTTKVPPPQDVAGRTQKTWQK